MTVAPAHPQTGAMNTPHQSRAEGSVVHKRLYSVPMAALQTARVTCRRNDCGGVAEVPVAKLYKVASAKCPACGEDFYFGTDNPNPLSRLRAVLDELGQLKQYVTVEFVVPDDAAG